MCCLPFFSHTTLTRVVPVRGVARIFSEVRTFFQIQQGEKSPRPSPFHLMINSGDLRLFIISSTMQGSRISVFRN